jgi:hypothetical protein
VSVYDIFMRTVQQYTVQCGMECSTKISPPRTRSADSVPLSSPSLTLYGTRTLLSFPYYASSVSYNKCFQQMRLVLYLYFIYRVSHEKGTKLRERVPYVKVYRYNPKHLCPKLNGYGDNGQRKVWSSGGSTHCACQLTSLIDVCP